MWKVRLTGALVGGLIVAAASGASRSAGACSCALEYFGAIELESVEQIEGTDDVDDELARWASGALQVVPNTVAPDELVFYVSNFQITAERRDE